MPSPLATRRALRPLALLTLTLAASPTRAEPAQAAQAPELRCSVAHDPAGRLELVLRLRNRGGSTIYLWNDLEMPYVVVEGRTIRLLARLYPPPEGKAMPQRWIATRILRPGGVDEHHVSLAPLRERSIYALGHPRVEPHGRYQVRCEAGYGVSPIRAQSKDFQEALEWQRVVAAKAIEVRIP